MLPASTTTPASIPMLPSRRRWMITTTVMPAKLTTKLVPLPASLWIRLKSTKRPSFRKIITKIERKQISSLLFSTSPPLKSHLRLNSLKGTFWATVDTTKMEILGEKRPLKGKLRIYRSTTFIEGIPRIFLTWRKELGLKLKKIFRWHLSSLAKCSGISMIVSGMLTSMTAPRMLKTKSLFLKISKNLIPPTSINKILRSRRKRSKRRKLK